MGLVKNWQTCGSVGGHSAMESQTQGKHFLKPRFAPPEGTEGSLLSSFVFLFLLLVWMLCDIIPILFLRGFSFK